MGLDQLASQTDESNDSSSSGGSSSGSSSSSSSTDRRYDDEVIIPYWAIIEDDNGDLRAVHRDPRANIIMRDGEVIKTHKRVVEHWTSSNSFRRAKALVGDELGMDLLKLLKLNTEEALTAYREAQKCADPSHISPHQTECGLCECTIHAVHTDYVELDDEVICATHTADELKEKDYL